MRLINAISLQILRLLRRILDTSITSFVTNFSRRIKQRSFNLRAIIPAKMQLAYYYVA